jgi:hypothetical protein
MSELSNGIKKHTSKSRETIPLKMVAIAINNFKMHKNLLALRTGNTVNGVPV